MKLNKINKYLIFLIFACLGLSNLYSEDYHSFLKKKADQGDAISQNDLGHMYLDGFPDSTFLKIMIKLFYILTKLQLKTR